MYAVVQTGGKQYRVQPGDILTVESLPGQVGDTVELSQVCLVQSDHSLQLGTPWVEHAKVTAEIVEQGRARSITVFKKHRRKNYRRTKGHRQRYTRLRITKIQPA